MDLRTIINTDSAVGAARGPQQLHPQQPQHHQQHQHQQPQQQQQRLQRPLSIHSLGPDESPLRSGSIHDDHPPQHHEYGGGPAGGRPSQPHPLQPPLQSPKRMAASYMNSTAQSPYQQPPLASILTSREPGERASSVLSVPREPYSASSLPPPSAASLSSPFTPQPTSAGTQHSSYFSQQRSHSVHSAASPSSVRSLSYPSGREPSGHPYSPSQQQQQHQAYHQQQQQQQQHYQQQQQQPQQQQPQQQRSQPGTPLAPPGSSYRRPSPHPVRPPSSGHDAPLSARLGSPWGSQDASSGGQRDGVSPTTRIPGSFPWNGKKEQHLDSVSPKTVVSQQGAAAYGDINASNTINRDNAISSNHSLLSQPVQTPHKDPELTQQTTHQPGLENQTFPPTTARPSYPPSTPQTASISNITNSTTASGSPTSRRPVQEASPSLQHHPLPPKPLHQSRSSISAAPGSSSSSERVPMCPPRKKRKRYTQPPIFACKAPRLSGTPPPIPPKGSQAPPQPQPSIFPGKRPLPKRESLDRNVTSDSLPPRPSRDGEMAVNGNTVKEPSGESPLGPWEPTITNVIPAEEVTKLICDFLFQQVVMRKDIGAGPAGGTAVGSGAILEVEAKLGRLIDKSRGERLRLPVLSETVISKDDPNFRLAFESSMSQAQHRAMNNFLNEAVKTSISQGTARIPLAYAHKRERDTFYDISANDLPPIVQHHLHPRHKPRVRVTTDVRTGAVIARIVKCRIADLDVYSPRTCLDWRISVNLEMNYDGDLDKLQQPSDWKRNGDRNKDRMSYRHLAYQIDLTQVGTTDSAPSDFEHELEIEISSAEIRRQGDLALSGDMNNRYEDLIKGFVDNIRVLARAVPG
ncbi:mRNA-capping enzyme subunit beta [Nannizzia gypsea CBS 118893]|uniref:mRNA-capping enzyme subunit beta n=1 Tax=Arthroderma gypseum (strain ATCC MYA-4604 / CBS 118893) TaxID=535722 RepID=E4V5L5_ARTGP|nr:mRNA-capping enzyme subunit beta [Nannizzia gypsea CBS 118893]EFR05390.1 mRNA-capping enzyme subunit beta [Nannizzia gypsea CBS 118893]